MHKDDIIKWLLDGDISIRYQVHRDLLGQDKLDLRKRIESEGWGFQFLERRQPNGHWGQGFYQPKWISTHYTLLDLKNLSIFPKNKVIYETIEQISTHNKGRDGGINPAKATHNSDVCVCGMFLNYACYFRINEDSLLSVIDFLLTQRMADGGFNCNSNGIGAVHSSLHTTLSVLEGINEYEINVYSYRLEELIKVKEAAQEFIVMHKLFRSDKSGEIINPNFLKLRHPCRWYYDILRALDYFRSAKFRYDNRIDDAIEIIQRKRKKSGVWNLAAKHPGTIHFEMEKAGKPSRWNTLRAMRVLDYFGV